MKEPVSSLFWLKSIPLIYDYKWKNDKEIVKALREQISASLDDQEVDKYKLERCVYVIRMKGEFTIAYPKQLSPVLYIGRGNAFIRLSNHLKAWMSQFQGFGKNVGIEIRVCRARRRNSSEMFKYVEADMIKKFQKKYGCVPFFNSRKENSYEGRVKYTKSDENTFASVLGIGRGKRPKWAISPAPSNKNYYKFYKGHAE